MKCKDLHPSDARCHNCLPPTQISYKLKKDCKNHAPFPLGLCTKCVPPTANLTRQQYRHVDYVQFMNFNEIKNFMESWSSNFGVQKVGYLYGYYSRDPNYPVDSNIYFRMECVLSSKQFMSHHNQVNIVE